MPRINGFLQGYVDLIGFQNHAGSYSGAALQDIVFQPSGQVSLRPFDASGVLEYRFGPYEAWAVRTSTPVGGSPENDGFWPIPHSGNILEMFATQAPTLQNAYQTGRTIFVTSTDGPLEITSASDKLTLASNGTHPHIAFSGLLEEPGTDDETGDFFYIRHAGRPGTVSAPSSDAEAQAQSLGYGTFAYNSGSGIVPIVTGSGIFECKDDGAQTFTGTEITIPLSNAGIPDENYYVDTTNDQVVILSPGTYFFGYAVNVDHTSGTSRSQSRVRPRHNGSTNWDALTSYTYNRQATEGDDTATNFGWVLLDAGDTIELRIQRTAGGATLTTIADQTHIMLWKVGPKRSGTNPE